MRFMQKESAEVVDEYVQVIIKAVLSENHLVCSSNICIVTVGPFQGK